jgi:aryl-alcohol dehydrogenase-like predicted oxidoreductase
MNYRKFPISGWQVSEIGLGTWQLGADWGMVEEPVANNILETSIDSGINFFDTADVYGLGLSEIRIRNFLRNHKDKVYVATKLGRFPKPGWPENFSLEAFRTHTENSLRRLGVEALDLTQVHCLPTEVIQNGEVFDWLRELKREGKIKQFGFSVESMEEAELCLQQEGVASLQIIFNILRQKPATVLFDKALQKGVALIVRLPLASGLLSGKMNSTSKFPKDDHRNYNSDGQQFNVGETFAGLPFKKGVELTTELQSMLPEGMTLSQMAMRWILDHPAVTVAIPGATQPEQVRSNASASDLPRLDDALLKKLEHFYQEKVHSHIRGKY